ncbi:MAG: LytTR family DNA-binding domain-containing protein [Bacteroidota bacterium]
MQNIRAVIIEDEENGLINMISRLETYCPNIEVVGTCQTKAEAVKLIRQKEPDLVFLDIQLGPENGFDILDQFSMVHFQLIITTQFHDRGIEAIRANALDYLVKPVDPDELIEAVKKVEVRLKERNHQLPRIAIPMTKGMRLVSMEEIIYIEADNQRSVFHLFNREKVRAVRGLGEVYEKLRKFNFYRIHRAFVINIDYVERISKENGGYVFMSNGDKLKVTKDYEWPGLLPL